MRRLSHTAHPRGVTPPCRRPELQQEIADRLNDVLDMMTARTGASVPADHGLVAGGLVRLTVAEVAQIAALVGADQLPRSEDAG